MKGLLLRSLITGLNGNSACKKALGLLLIALLCFGSNKGLAAGVSVSPGSGGSNICSVAALGGTSPAYTTLGNIVVTESNAGDLPGPGTDVLVLSAPAGWQFNTTALPNITYLTDANIVTTPVFTITATSITISIATNGTNVLDQFMIRGLQVQATSTSAAAGNIYSSSYGGIAGLTPTTNFGSLSLSAPQTPSVTIAASPSGAICPGTNVLFLPSPVSGGTAPVYQWKVNGANVTTGATYSSSGLVSGNKVSCVMTSNSSCLTSDTAVSNTYTVTVLPGPLPVSGATVTCPGTIITLNDATTGGTWSSGNSAVATTDGSGDVTGVAVGTAIISYISGGCPAIANITVNNPPLAPVLTTTVATMCSGNITTMTAIGTPFPTTILSQNFNSGITPWVVDSTGGLLTVPGSAWKNCGNGYVNEQGIYYSPDSSGFAMSNSDTSGSSSYTSSKLISPVFSLAGYSGATLTFQQAYEYWPAGDSIVSAQISTDSGSTWTTLQNYAGTNIGSRTDFIQETFSLNAYLGQTKLRLRFYYYCHWGYYWAIDNVLVTGISSIAIPVWAPSTYLYTNAACTAVYTSGTALSTVYVHPTNITFAGAVTYTATAVSVGCSTANSSAVNFTPSPSPILGTGALCVGTTTSLSDTTAIGTWSSDNTGIATVSGGVVTGVTTGTATMSYVLGTGCAATIIVTVNSLPAAIGGSKTVCLGAMLNLSDTTASGLWTSGNTATATIGSTGIVTSVTSGTANITYAIGTGCNSVATITVNPLPSIITGNATICMGLTATLSDSIGGGAWSSGATAIATAGSGSGVITGVTSGSAFITYTLGTGCKASMQVSVNPLLPIAGTFNVCVGLSATLSDGVTGGTWSSSNTAVATIGSGVVQGVIAGTTTISYILPTGCTATIIFTVNPNPPAINGSSQVCVGSTTNLTDATAGGAWSSLLVIHATIGGSTGIVTGVATGSSVIRYTLPTGCFTSQNETVNPPPGAISGNMIVCATLSVTLSNGTAGGTWSSGTFSVATAGSTTGIVSGVAGGTSVITYTLPTTCAATAIVTVNPLPGVINGNSQVCFGLTSSLSDATHGGTWSSSATSIATIGTGGIVTGAGLGVATITYTLATGCIMTAAITVDPLPGSVNGTPVVCAGITTTLSDTSAGGVWSSGATGFATVPPDSGIVTGVAGGTAVITYMMPTGCLATNIVTVNPLPNTIIGTVAVCVGLTTALSTSTTGGAWSSSSTTIGNVGSSGLVTGISAGTTSISYILGTGCFTSATVTVSALPLAISGSNSVCEADSISLDDGTTGGTWSTSNTAVAGVGSGTGNVTGLIIGTTAISYTIPIANGVGCSVGKIITVNLSPTNINGNAEVCLGFTTNLSDTTTDGVWTSSNPSFATVGSGTGLVTTSSAGTVNIYYTLPTGCAVSRTVSVNPQPSIIGGTTDICGGTETVLTDTISDGSWSSGNTAIATIGAGTGLLTGIGSGTTTISYALDAGCVATITVTVHVIPSSISGNNVVCAGYTTMLSDPLDASGTWSSSNTSIATIGATTGIITGASAGSATITYSLGVGCTFATIVTVNPLPSGIIETTDLCFGANITLSDTTNGGVWSCSSTGIAAIGSLTGNVSGIINGVVTITYKLGTSCQTTMALTVYPLPASIAGTVTVCAGLGINLSDATAGGTWSSGTTGIAVMGSVAGVVTGVAGGTATVSYILGTGCFVTDIVTVNPLPKPIIGNNEVCVGLSTNLTDSTIGGNWSSGAPGIAAVGSATGIVNGVIAGTGNITYTLTTGCINTMMVTVNPLPSGIAGITNVCQGLTITLTDISGGGVWSSGSSGIGSIGSVSGVVAGISAGVTAITYILSTGCLITKSITVNPAPTAIYGANNLCIGNAITLNDTTLGGVWSSGSVTIGIVGTSSGIVSGILNGTTIITYTTSHGCITAYPVTVNPLPGTISGTKTVCAGGTTNLSDALTGGVWSSGSPGIAGVGSVSGIVNGYLQGTTIITYTSVYGCIITAVVTVNPLPAAISGANNVCAGSAITVTDTSPGGTWSSSNITVATVGSGSGIISSVSAGSVNITYTLGTGCIISQTITVNPLPSMIAGNKNVCQGLMTTLNDTLTGGIWASSNAGSATIGTSSGSVTGISTGTSVITYTLPTGCRMTTNFTVNPLPSSISGNTTFCVGLTTTLSDITTSGTWSSGSTGIATVGSVTGVVTGVSAGAATITYTLITGCIAIATVTVNTLAPISGATFICSGTTTILSDANGSGIWSSSNTGVAMVGSLTGNVSGNISGTSTITFVFSAGCVTSTVVTVNSLPSSITGTTNVCAGLGITLSDNTAGGNWISNNVSVATINSSTGYLTGIAAGTTLITYGIGGTGCTTTTTITVNSLPAVINGVASVCKGLITGLSDSTAGGRWNSSNAGVASVGTGTGVVTGITAGTANITYTLTTGCIQTMTVSVDQLPSLISGTKSICAGLSTNFTDSMACGTWASAEAPGIVTVDGISGAVTGVLAGTAVITYTLLTGCINTTIVTVNPLPSAINGTMAVCAGLTISLSDPSAGGVWTSSATSVATVGSGTGVVAGIASGVTTITYVLPTGCIATTGVTVNPLPAAITGVDSICAGLTTSLSDINTGGAWSIAGSPGIASVNAANGIVTAISTGTAMVTYTLGTGCITKIEVTVNPLPHSITGIPDVCAGLTTGLTDATATGVWSSSGSIGILSVGSATGIVTGIGAGMAMITYTLGTGCIATVNITVNPLPANPQSMTGAANVCAGLSIELTDVTIGGVWSSGSTGIATIGAASGIVSGLVAGTASITYTLSTGCIATTIITVNPLPGAIIGVMNVCAGSAISMSDGTTGGIWSSSITMVGSVSTSGVVTGISAGTTVISYVLTTGCQQAGVMTVNPLPAAVAGAAIVCTGTMITLSDASGGGIWITGNTSIAAAGSGTGIITGVSAGTVVITYTLPTSCNITFGLTVLSSPVAITGITNVCAGLSTALSDITVGGVWSSGATGVATVGSTTGMVIGIAAGTTTISYTVGNGCYTAQAYTVNPLPLTISGDRSVCIGSSSDLSDGLTGGTWSIAGAASIATIGATSGIVNGLILGTAIVTYTLPTGCITTAEITVNPYPAIITGATIVCQGAAISMSDATATGAWSSGNTAIATVNATTGTVTGTGGGSVTISYTLITGCYVTEQVTVNPIFPIVGHTDICAGSSYVFSDLTSGGTWSSSNTTVATITAATGAANAIASGTTIISYGLSTGCNYNLIITVNATPASFYVVGGGNYCAGGSGVMIGLNGSDAGISYEVYKGAVLIATTAGTGAAIYYGPYTNAGSYDIVAIDVATGCTDTMVGVATINISPIMTPSVSIVAGIGDTICAGISAAFTAIPINGGAAPAYEWFVNGVHVAVTGDSYSYIPSPGDVVSVQLTSDAACVTPDTASSAYHVMITPDLLPSVSISASPADSLCAHEITTIIPAPVNGGASPVYRWVKNGLTAGYGDVYTYTPVNGDNIFCVLYSNYRCLIADSTNSENINFMVEPLPVVSISAHPGTTIAYGQDDTLIAVVGYPGAVTAYQWEINSIAISGATTNIYISDSLLNNDTVACIVSSSGLCSDVPVKADIIMHVNNTGVNQLINAQDNIKLLPNPNNGQFTLAGTIGNANDAKIRLEVTDMLGQVVFTKDIFVTGGKINELISLSPILSNGMYLLYLLDATSSSSGQVNTVFHFVINK